ncbi:Transcriptional regulatory protein LiaR [Mycobacteroides salmoniphilum]|uniref:Transcriptional regulatory protein LiaR n=2 Tax=Mycobacteroides salmoniphilum TaxID=404941 RepID=A0A4R8S2E1_9MYCO|nr:Transcriptional regulatory protein LiaR [Mycobacteroides salmoniphilum]
MVAMTPTITKSAAQQKSSCGLAHANRYRDLDSVSMSGSWQLLDRPTEFEAVRSTLADDVSCGVVLVGSAGVGKTTLARTVTDSLECQVRWVACTESSRSIPLGVFAHWIQTTGSRDPAALIAAARESIVATPHPIIGIDDAHLLDDLSATLLHQIAVGHACRLVATVRSGEPVPDAVTALWKDDYLRRFELEAFTKEQSVALVESVLGGALEGLSADVMWESSAGNPLFLRHLVEGAVEAGSLTAVHGVWQLRGNTVVPSGLAALLGDRLEQLDGDVLNVLKLLSLCEPLNLDTLCEIAGGDALDGAELTGFVRVEADGQRINVRFSHPMLGEVVRRRVGTASARRLRGQLVRALRERDTGSAAKRIRLAQLSVDSDEATDPAFLVSAAKDAVYLSNLPVGEHLARCAVERDGGLRAAEVLSRALLWQGRPEEAEQALAEFDPDQLDELSLVLWGLPLVSIAFWSMGDVKRAHELMALLRERVQHPALKLVVDATGAALAVHENQFDEGLAAATLVLSDPEAPRQAVEFAAFGIGLALPVAGRGDEFEPIAARCRAQKRSTDGMIAVMVRYCDVLALVYTGQLWLADRRVTEYTEFSSAGQFLAWAIARIMAGLVAVHRGAFPTAISSIEQALAALNAERPLPWQLPARLLLARAYAALGKVEDAERVLTESGQHSGQFVALHDPQLLIAKSWLAAARGADRSAVDAARRAADAAHTAGQYAVEAEALHHAARFGDRTVGRRLGSLVPRVHGPLVGLYARHAIAVGTSDAAALDTVSEEFENAGLLLSAADAAAQAVALRGRDGDRGKSAESAARALRIAGQCGGAATPAIRAAARPLPVTAREREIAALIGEGLCNREIAERLTLSVRTIEGHIYRACIKLDVADRDQLAKIVWSDLTNPQE